VTHFPLFMFFINDIAHNIRTNMDDVFTLDELSLFMLLYADDVVLFAKSKETLQNMLHDLRVYCDRWDLKVNTVKSKVMLFEKGRATHPVVFYGNTQLDIVASFKYLGIEFFNNGDWYRTQKKLSEQVSHTLLWRSDLISST
jgi:hypothetical protein